MGAQFASPRARAALDTLAPALAILAVQLILFPLPAGVALQGFILGLLGALVAVGMALIYRANRILNFAQSELGAVPTVMVVSLVAFAGLNYFFALALGLVAALVLGSLVELAIIRRFFNAPRLILTVATIGLAQLLAVGSLFIPVIWGKTPTSTQIHAPFTVRFVLQPIVFSADHLIALVVAPLALLAVAVILRFTSIGIAIRASAERADRASLLGVPVKRLQTVVWAMATLLSFIAVFMRASILGLPVGAGLSLTLLLASLAALMLGKLTQLPSIAAAAVALGMLEQGVVWNYPRNPELVDPILAVVVVACLLFRKIGTTRADQDGSSSWQAAAEVRPVPRELRALPEVRLARWGGGLLVAACLVGLPLVLHQAGDRQKVAAVVIFAIIALSVVVLTGWAGQVSLGQMSLVAFGAAVGSYSTQHWHLDLALALVLASIVGALVAILVGLPALRLRGLFLAVTTLAFAMATSSFLLDDKHFSWVPTERVVRPKLFGTFSLSSQVTYYELCLACLVLVVLAVRGIRHSRTGRVLLALRENERGAQSFGINVTRAKLTAFALSGAIAAFAGCLLVHLLQAFDVGVYSPTASFVVFTSAVVGGLGSLLGAMLGALYLQGGYWFLPGPRWQQLSTSLGVLLVLMILPGGLADIVYRLRDAGLRWVATRRQIIVPSLLADVAPPGDDPDPDVVAHAEAGVEAIIGAVVGSTVEAVTKDADASPTEAVTAP